MKKTGIAFALLVAFSLPQAKAQFMKNAKKESTINWQNQSFEQDGVYGAEVNKAYELLKGKKPKKKVLVALIGPGIDVEHEDLKDNIWNNPKEKPNGKDDDKNGLIDDINGWNFLGNADGEVLDVISREGDREFLRLKDKELYSRIFPQNGKYYMYDREQKKRVEAAPPKDVAEYNYYRNEVIPESRLGKTYIGLSLGEYVKSYIPEFDKELKAKFPNKKITQKDFASIVDKDISDGDTLRATAFILLGMGFATVGVDDWDVMSEYMKTKHQQYQQDSYEKQLEKIVKDDRKIIGDNPFDINDKSYGNNILMAENSGFGTLYGGVIAAKRNNNIGIDGIADNVELMTLRIDADYNGEPYMKDMALAIRYAVDHGADIIQMGKANTFFPVNQSGWVKDALVYAESKGVLVVMSMRDLSYNLDKVPFYPNKHISATKELTNFITVAASDINGNPMLETNFSNKELDLFAPGKDIYSTYTADTYRSFSSSDMAASVVTGVAALIKSYYPKLTGTQLRTILMENVTPRTDAEVEKEFYPNESRKAKDLFLFQDLCVSGGILNALKALQAAEKVSK